MRTLHRLLLATAFAIGASGHSGAEVLTLSEGTLGISLGALPPITFPCTNAGPGPDCPQTSISVSTGGGSFTEPANLLTGTVALPTALFTGVAQINGLTIIARHNQKVLAQDQPAGPNDGNLVRNGGGFGGQGVLSGSAIINVLGNLNLGVPLSAIGNTGGSLSVGSSQAIQIYVYGTGWTTAPVQITGVSTADPNATPNAATPNINTVTIEGYDNRTPGHAGIVQLVSPFKAVTNVAGNLPGLATQTLTFVPEPGSLLLLCSGVAVLGVCGWLRLRGK